MKRRLVSLWLPSLLWMAVIFIGSHQQGLPTPHSSALDLLIKKSGHILEYGILGLLLWRACRGSYGLVTVQRKGILQAQSISVAYDTPAPLASAVVLGALYALSDEVHQRFVPTRTGNLRDVAIDITALSAAVILAWLWQRYRSRPPGQL